MIRFEDLIVHLMDTVPLDAGDLEHDGLALEITGLDIEMPIETRIDRGAVLTGSLPRGRLKTGFDAPHSRVHARFSSRGV